MASIKAQGTQITESLSCLKGIWI